MELERKPYMQEANIQGAVSKFITYFDLSSSLIASHPASTDDFQRIKFVFETNLFLM